MNPLYRQWFFKGFRHFRYERTTAVSEGAECCDYRLRYDPDRENTNRKR